MKTIKKEITEGKKKTCTTRACNYFQDPGVQLEYV